MDQINLSLTAGELSEIMRNANLDDSQIAKVLSPILAKAAKQGGYENELDKVLEEKFGLKPDSHS